MNMNSENAYERSPSVSERHPETYVGVLAGDLRDVYATGFWTPSRVALLIIAAFWIGQVLIATGQQLISTSTDAEKFLVPRTLSSAAGALISIGMLKLLNLLARFSLGTRSVGALVLAVAGTFVLAAFNYPIFQAYVPAAERPPFTEVVAYDFLSRFWMFVAISAAFLSMSYSADIREREQRIHALQTLAQIAQIRALRNQLNPHFLFNALNSIAGLISAKRGADAESMTENLADFLRLALALDPQELIPLRKELELQALYLSIEQVRFPRRLQVNVNVPPKLIDALVPSLITQPLIENCIKHAVARSTGLVELNIEAKLVDGALHLVVSNTGGNAVETTAKGASLGLRNVSERLRMHYGDDGALSASADDKGEFRNVISIPLRTQG
jgi:two-component system LytT family sensor kinase